MEEGRRGRLAKRDIQKNQNQNQNQGMQIEKCIDVLSAYGENIFVDISPFFFCAQGCMVLVLLNRKGAFRFLM